MKLTERIKKWAKKTALTGGLLLGSMLPAYAGDLPSGFDIMQDKEHLEQVASIRSKRRKETFYNQSYRLSDIIIKPSLISLDSFFEIGSPSTSGSSSFGGGGLRAVYDFYRDKYIGAHIDFLAAGDFGNRHDYIIQEGYYEVTGEHALGLIFVMKEKNFSINLGIGEYIKSTTYKDEHEKGFVEYERGSLGIDFKLGVDFGRYAGTAYDSSKPFNLRFSGGIRGYNVAIGYTARDLITGEPINGDSSRMDARASIYGDVLIDPMAVLGLNFDFRHVSDSIETTNGYSHKNVDEVYEFNPHILISDYRMSIRIGGNLEIRNHRSSGYMGNSSYQDTRLGINVGLGNLLRYKDFYMNFFVEGSIGIPDSGIYWNASLEFIITLD